MNKFHKDQDTKALIHKIVKHGDFKKIAVPMTLNQKKELRNTFTTEQIWGCKVPADF